MSAIDSPVLCWCCTINPNISDEEFSACYNAVMEAWPGNSFAEKLKEMPRNYDTLREMVTYLIPLLMMRQQRIPRTKWRLHQTDRGKKWIEKTVDSSNHPTKRLTMMTGFTTAYDYNLVVLAACQGKRSQVVNIGLGVKRLSADGVPVQRWAQSQQHKLTPREVQMLTGLQDEVLLSRLIILLTIKESLMNGLGQPVGFDLSRIECNPVEEWLTVDGQPLHGWEFRLFRCQGEALVNDQHIIDQYQISVAFYRGNNAAKFVFVEKPGDIDRLTQYFPFDRLVDVIPRLLQESKSAV